MLFTWIMILINWHECILCCRNINLGWKFLLACIARFHRNIKKNINTVYYQKVETQVYFRWLVTNKNRKIRGHRWRQWPIFEGNEIVNICVISTYNYSVFYIYLMQRYKIHVGINKKFYHHLHGPVTRYLPHDLMCFQKPICGHSATFLSWIDIYLMI